MGSGKSYLGKELSGRIKIKNYDLDDIFWKKKYSVRESPEVMSKKVEKIIKKDSWIIEGIQYYNHDIEKTFKAADEIIWVNPSIVRTVYRLLRRYFFRLKFKQEDARDTLVLIRGAIKYKLNIKSKSRRSHEELMKKYSDKVVRVRIADRYLEGLK